MIVQPGLSASPRLAHLAFCGNDDDVRRANNIAFQRGGTGFGDPFSENSPGRPRRRVFGCRVASRRMRAVAFRDVTRRKQTMCLAVLRCAGAMKISATSLPRDREKINIASFKREEGRWRRYGETERINTMNREASRG